MPFPVGRNDTKHRVTETQSFVFLSTAHRVYGPFVCSEAADSVVPLVIFLQTVTGLCVSVFDINYTLCGLEWCISTLPALHVLTFRTSGSFQLRTSGSYWLRTFASCQPRTIGNLEEVELWVTAGGSPKGNTCGLPHLSSFSHVDLEGVEPRLFCQKEPFITTNELEQLFRESHRLCHSLWFMMYCVTTSFPDIEAVAVHERRQRKRSRQLHQHTHVVLCGSTPFEVDVRERG